MSSNLEAAAKKMLENWNNNILPVELVSVRRPTQSESDRGLVIVCEAAQTIEQDALVFLRVPGHHTEYLIAAAKKGARAGEVLPSTRRQNEHFCEEEVFDPNPRGKIEVIVRPVQADTVMLHWLAHMYACNLPEAY